MTLGRDLKAWSIQRESISKGKRNITWQGCCDVSLSTFFTFDGDQNLAADEFDHKMGCWLWWALTKIDHLQLANSDVKTKRLNARIDVIWDTLLRTKNQKKHKLKDKWWMQGTPCHRICKGSLSKKLVMGKNTRLVANERRSLEFGEGVRPAREIQTQIH